MTLKIQVFLDVTQTVWSIRNVGTHSPKDTASHPRRCEISTVV